MVVKRTPLNLIYVISIFEFVRTHEHGGGSSSQLFLIADIFPYNLHTVLCSLKELNLNHTLTPTFQGVCLKMKGKIGKFSTKIKV